MCRRVICASISGCSPYGSWMRLPGSLIEVRRSICASGTSAPVREVGQRSWLLPDLGKSLAPSSRAVGDQISLVQHCRTGRAEAFTPADFPAAHIDQDELDDLLAQLDEA